MQKRIILGYGVELHEAELLSTLNKLFDKFTQTDIDDLIIEMLEPSNDKTNIYRYLPESKIQAMTENGFDIQLIILNNTNKAYLCIKESNDNSAKRNEIKQVITPYFVDLLISWISPNVKFDLTDEKITNPIQSTIKNIFQDIKIPVSY